MAQLRKTPARMSTAAAKMTNSTSKATTITIYSLGAFLALTHIFFGVIALTPTLNRDYHNEMIINYSAFAKSVPHLQQQFGRANAALYLRYFISISEIVFATLLLENGYFTSMLHKIGNLGLIIVDLAFFTLQMLANSSYERKAPTIVFMVLLVARFVISEQSNKRVAAAPVVKPRTKRTVAPKKTKNE